MSMTWLHFPLEPWTQNSVSVSRGNSVSCDENNQICRSFYQWSKEFFQYAATTLRLTAINLMQNETVKNNDELKTQIWDAFGEFYQAIQMVDENLILAIYHKEIEPIEASVSSFSTDDPLPDNSNVASVVEELWSKMKSIMEKAIDEMSPDTKWSVLFKDLINSGEKHSSELQALLKENSL